MDAAALEELVRKLDRLIVIAEKGSGTVPAGTGPADPGARTEVRESLAELGRQFEDTINAVIQRLADETVGLRRSLELALEEVERRDGRDRETMRKAFQAAFHEVLERQSEDKEALRVHLQAAMDDARDEFRSGLKGLADQLVDTRPGGQQQLRAAFDSALGDQKVRTEVAELKELVLALRTQVAAGREDVRRQLQSEVEAALARRDQELGSLLAERWQSVNGQFQAAVEEVVRLQAQAWDSRRADLEAALADGNEQLQQALAEENARLRALEAALLGQATQSRMQWRADLEAALTAGRDVAMALVGQATDRLVTLGEEVATSITRAYEDRSREQGEQLNDLQAAFEDLTSAIGLERKELRVAIEAGLDTSDLAERLDALTVGTAQGAKDVAAAIDKLRRRPRTEARVADLLTELYDQLEQLRRRIPTRGEVRLADDQMAKILAAVKATRTGPAAAPPGARKAAGARPAR